MKNAARTDEEQPLPNGRLPEGRVEATRVEEADVEAPTPEIARRGGTFESFRHRDFSLFWSGALVSNVGSWMQNYALAVVVYALRDSEFDLGLITFLTGIPILFLALPGGLIADRFDRRRLLMSIQFVLLAQAAALGLLYNSGSLSSKAPLGALVWLAVLGIAAGALNAVQFPAWQAMLPDLVPRPSLLNAIALNAAQFQSSRMLGPALAGALVVAGAGMGEIFYANAVSFLFVILALWFIRTAAAPTESSEGAGGRPARTEGVWQTLVAGIKYARAHRAVGMVLISTAVMTVFGFAYITLLPAIVNETLGYATKSAGYTRVTALIMAANGLGAMVGALTVASMSHSLRPQRIIPYSLLSFGVLLTAFGLISQLWLLVVLSTLAGAALMTTNSLTNALIQSTVPRELRGRVLGLFVMAFLGMMPISGLIFGTVGQVIGPSPAVVVGSVALIAWALLLVVRPNLLRSETTAADA